MFSWSRWSPVLWHLYVGAQARGVLAMDGGTSSDPYCKVTLGKEKHRSKVSIRLLEHIQVLTSLPDHQEHPQPQVEGGHGSQLVRFHIGLDLD